jgi:hypothetical protein
MGGGDRNRSRCQRGNLGGRWPQDPPALRLSAWSCCCYYAVVSPEAALNSSAVT